MTDHRATASRQCASPKKGRRAANTISAELRAKTAPARGRAGTDLIGRTTQDEARQHREPREHNDESDDQQATEAWTQCKAGGRFRCSQPPDERNLVRVANVVTR